MPEKPKPDETLAGEQLRELMAGAIAHNKRFETNDSNLRGLVSDIRETIPQENREYWSYEGRLLPQATPEELKELDAKAEAMGKSGDTHRMSFEYKTPPGHERELSCEMVINDGIMDERLYKFVIPESQWDKFERLADQNQDSGSLDVLFSRPWRVSARRTVLSAYPVDRSNKARHNKVDNQGFL